MEKEPTGEEVYDYRQFDRIWQRVSPELNPYPEARAETSRQTVADGGLCCLAGGSADLAAQLGEMVDEELSDRCAYLTYARCAPAYARRRLLQMAAEEEHHARRLLAVYYLATGRCYHAVVPTCPDTAIRWCALLRQLYHHESCGAQRYEQGAAATEDICLREIFRELAAEERCHARQILQWLEKTALA